MSNKNTTIEQNNYVYSFDGLRTIAIVLVMLYHMIPYEIKGGYLGVVIFLVLSGYLVTDNLLNEIDTKKSINIFNFWKKRLVKLYKPLLPMLLVVGLIVLFFFKNMLVSYTGNAISSIFGVNNLYQILNGQSYFEAYANPNPLTHLWFLGLEIQFYLIWPIVIAILYSVLKLKRNLLAIIMFVLSLISAALMQMLYQPGIDVSRIYYGLDTRFFGFLVGACLACAFPRRKLSYIKLPSVGKVLINILSMILLIVLIYFGLVLEAQLDVVYQFGMYLYAVLVGCFLIVLIMSKGIVSKALSLSPLTYISKRSYSLYLWHYPIILFTTQLLKFSKISLGLLLALEFILSMVVAEISYQLFEQKRKSETGIFSNRYFVVGKYGLIGLALAGTLVYAVTVQHHDAKALKAKLEMMAQEQQEESNLMDYIAQENLLEAQRLEAERIKAAKEAEEAAKAAAEEAARQEAARQAEEAAKRPSGSVPDVITDGITFVGDSVMLGARDSLSEGFSNAVIDAKISRQYWDLPDVFNNLKSSGRMNRVVVIHTGTNYDISKEKFTNMLKSLGNRQIFLITCVVPNAWEQSVNRKLSEIANEMSNVELIDWYGYAKGNSSWFYGDATHLNPRGANQYADLIKSVLNSKMR